MSSVLIASRIYFFVSVAVLAMKFVAYYLTGSLSVLTDAMETIVNVVAALVTMRILQESGNPADEDHPYGHGKLEYFSATFEGGLIAFAGLAMTYEAVKALWFGHEVEALGAGLPLVIAAGVVNLGLGLYLKVIGRRAGSEALRASSEHLLADVKTTAASLVALAAVRWTGQDWIDALIGLVLSLHLIQVAWGIVNRSMGPLVDKTDPKALEELIQSFRKARVPGLIDVHKIRVIQSGAFHHVDAHLVVPRYWSVDDSHRNSQEFEQRVAATYQKKVEIAFHVDPCTPEHCVQCDLEQCPVRSSKFIELKPFGVAAHG